MDRQKLSITEPRAKRPDETEARVASILHQEDCPCTSPVHEAAYLDTARIVLSSIEAVPRAEADRLQRDADRVDRAQYHVERANTAQALLTEKATEVAKLSVAYVKSEEQLESAESQLAACRTALGRLDHLLAAPGGMSPGDVQDEGRGIIRAALGGPDDAPKEPKR